MNVYEERAWRLLLELGARETMIGGKHALDLSPIRVTSTDKNGLFLQAAIDVVGRSGGNRRHVDRRGCPIYVVTDYYTLDRETGDAVRAAEDQERVRRFQSRRLIVIEALTKAEFLDGSMWIALATSSGQVLPTQTIGLDDRKCLRWCDGIYDPRHGIPSRFGQEALLTWRQLQGHGTLIAAENHP